MHLVQREKAGLRLLQSEERRCARTRLTHAARWAEAQRTTARLNVMAEKSRSVRRRVTGGQLGPDRAKQHIKEKNAKIKAICSTNPAEQELTHNLQH